MQDMQNLHTAKGWNNLYGSIKAWASIRLYQFLFIFYANFVAMIGVKNSSNILQVFILNHDIFHIEIIIERSDRIIFL